MVLVLVIICVAALCYSVSDLFQYAGVDLRNRVVGARALLQSIDPYTIGWRPGMPIELADPRQRYPGVTRQAASAPSLLLLYTPFAELPYRTQQLIWWALQWVALGITITVLARSFPNQADRNIFLFLSIVCFVGSWFWRLHVERGQYYIFSTMLLSIDLATLRGLSGRPKWLGVPSGIAVAIKPTNVILLPMLWFLGERRTTLVAALTATLVVLASFYPSGPKIWLSFLSAVQDMTEYEVDPRFESKHFGPVQAVAPYVIEGRDFRKALPLGRDGDEITPSNITSVLSGFRPLSMLVVIALFILGPLAVWWLKRRRTAPRDFLLLNITLVLAALEFARPRRWPYVDVTFIPITAFLITTMPRSRAFLLLGVLTYACYLGPLESKWVVRARHLLTLTLACATVARVAVERSFGQPPRPPLTQEPGGRRDVRFAPPDQSDGPARPSRTGRAATLGRSRIAHGIG